MNVAPISSTTLLTWLILGLVLNQNLCQGQQDECTTSVRVSRLESNIFFYRCGWFGWWQCTGTRYYVTYTTLETCCVGYVKIDGRCRRKDDNTTPRDSACGVSMYDANKLIIGGVDAEHGEYPWLVSLVRGSHFCGGMIIDDHWIVTAAHCVQTTPFNVRVGEHDRYRTDVDEVTMSLERIVAHRNYDDVTVQNDIAMVKTVDKIKFNDYVKPVCLPDRYLRLSANTRVEIAGWGVTERGQLVSASRTLQKATMKVSDLSVCRYTYGTAEINDKMICVSDDYGNKKRAACNGDSGGPLMLRQNGVVYGIGLTSFGSSAGCATGDPVVYTDVSKYIDWINTVRNNY